MVIQEFNYLLKSSQSIETIKISLLSKINTKSNTNVGCIAKIYDTTNKKIYLLVSDNVKTQYLLQDNIFEVGSSKEISELGLDELRSELLAEIEKLKNIKPVSDDSIDMIIFD